AVRAALDDPRPVVRVAAARASGLARDAEALPGLERLVQSDQAAAVRRQAATASGQIGRASSASALLAAAAVPGDRFTEHAITHSLMTLDAVPALTRALEHPSMAVRKVALVALDQRRPSPLTRDQLTPFLADDAPELWETGVWVASHRPEWADTMTAFLTARLDAAPAPAAASLDVDGLLATFCAQPGVQALVLDRLNAPAASQDDRLRMIDVMQNCRETDVPVAWIDGIGTWLERGDAVVQRRLLQLVE